jgi:hypothetical protein
MDTAKHKYSFIFILDILSVLGDRHDIILGANQILDGSLVGTPRCGVRSAQRADPTKS